MVKKSRADLLREIQNLNERLSEQEIQLMRFKSRTAQSRKPRKKQEKAPAAAAVNPGILEWLVAALRPEAGLVVLDGAGRIASILGGSSAALGATQEDIVGAIWKNWIADEDRVCWQKFFENLDDSHIERHLSFRVKASAGNANLQACALRVPGAIWVALGPVNAAESLDATAVNRWAGVFAHELNQPLAAILTTAQACRNLLASGKVLPEEMLQGMKGLIRRVHHAADVVRRLRTLAGGEPPHRVSADLREVVRRALDVLQSPLAESHVRVTLDFAHRFPAVKVDSVQLVQVVVNLVRNAIEAMCNIPVSQRQLTVRAQFDSREAIVAVEDQGMGLSVDMIQRLFQPLASPKSTGMGLGLALCRQIVEGHGGRIWAKGNAPKGCVFSFSVPLESEEP